MNPYELIRFLKLLRNCGGLNEYWKNRINNIILQMGGSPDGTPIENPVEVVSDAEAIYKQEEV